MGHIFRSYLCWLHTRWPAGTVEKLPVVNNDSTTNVPGLYVTGDLTGIPLLKFAADSGTKAVNHILSDPGFVRGDGAGDDVLDLVIVGGGVSGFSGAIEARKAGLNFEIFEATEPFSTLVNFPKAKPIYTYPTQMTPAGDLQFHEESSVKEGLLEDLKRQTTGAGIEPTMLRVQRVVRRNKIFELETSASDRQIKARRVIVAIGRSGNFRKLGIPGEDLDKVYNRLHDPADFCGLNVAIVGGGDSALEAAIALTTCGCNVTLSYRKAQFSRPKPENVAKINQLVADPGVDVQVEEPTGDRVTAAVGDFMGSERMAGTLRLMMASKPKRITPGDITITDSQGNDNTITNDAVFAMLGREPPLEFFRSSGVKVRGDWSKSAFASLIAFVLFCFWLYHWKKPGSLPYPLQLPWWLNPDPARLWNWLASLNDTLGNWFNNPAHILGTLKLAASGPAFYYTLAYSLVIVIFGYRRIKRRKTPYVTAQTLTLMAIQIIPLFILPEIILPMLGRNGFFEVGSTMGNFADWFFESYDQIGHERAYWRAYGLIFAWPLFIYNFFTDAPMWGWLIIGSLQTFVIIPLLIYRWGKGAYCGWICSCGALAETLGDTHRHKMPHGPRWNRLNMLGQFVLLFAVVLLLLRVMGWMGAHWAADLFTNGFKKMPLLNYAWSVDLVLAGVLGYGLYFWYSGRMWCRFACPLAALMHIYARFSQFRILAEKSKCISCNVCTSVCHQGIDIMNFANKGLPMEDPQCVRCSACVQSCPTGVLSFGRINPNTGQVISSEKLIASAVRLAEARTK